MVTEYMSGGELADRLYRKDKRPSWDLRIKWLEDVSAGLMYLHYTHRSVHRDVKSGNILLTDHSENARAKLGGMFFFFSKYHSHHNKHNTDFGLAKVVHSGKKRFQITKELSSSMSKSDTASLWKRRMTSALGSPGWMAPELWEEQSVYGPAVDIYAFGIVMWECLQLCVPWRTKSVMEIRDAVKAGIKPGVSVDAARGAPMEYLNLMNRCLDHNFDRRPPIGVVNTTLVNDVISLEHSADLDHSKSSARALRARRESLISCYSAANTPECDSDDTLSPSSKIEHHQDAVEIDCDCSGDVRRDIELHGP